MLFFKQFDLLDENKKKTNNNTNFERNTFLRLNVKEIALNKNILKQISIILIQLFYVTSKEIKLLHNNCQNKIKIPCHYLKS